jgi:hypothetical protein
MNRQKRTNQKRYLSTTNAEEQAGSLCALCGVVENTMHLLFECAQCSEPLWELVGEAITALIRQGSPTAQTYWIHAYSAILWATQKSAPARKKVFSKLAYIIGTFHPI